MTRALKTRWMHSSLFDKRWALGVGLCALQAATAVTLAQGLLPSGAQPPSAAPAQGVPPSGTQPPRPIPTLSQGVPSSRPQPRPPSALTRANRLVNPMDDFAGLNLTSAQQAKVDGILGQTKARIDTVIKSNLNQDQKGAMVQGLERMERNDVYKILDPSQRQVVVKRVLARREAARLEQQKIKESTPQ